MTLPRYNPNRDRNEPDIVDALEKAGCDFVRRQSAGDWPDLLVGYHGDMHLIEVKSERGKLRDGQQATISRLQARGYRVHVARTPEDALHAIGAIR